MKVNQIVYGLTGPAADKEIKLRAARGEVALRTQDLLTSLAILAHDKDIEVAKIAKTKLASLDTQTLLKGIAEKVEAPVLREIAMLQTSNDAVMLEIAMSPIVDDTALIFIARKGSAKTAGIVSTLSERIKKNPAIEAALKQNPALAPKEVTPPPPPPAPAEQDATDDSGEDSAEETSGEDENSFDGRTLSKEEEEKILADAEKVDVPQDLTKDHVAEEEKPKNVTQMVAGMSVAERVKLGSLGNKEVRTLLVKSPNKLIYSAVMKNPRITEEEVLQLTSTKGTPEGLLRLVAKNKSWLENSAIKKSLIINPKTPVEVSVRLLGSLDLKEVEKISKSKGIPSALVVNAKKLVILKQKKK